MSSIETEGYSRRVNDKHSLRGGEVLSLKCRGGQSAPSSRGDIKRGLSTSDGKKRNGIKHHLNHGLT